MHIGHLCCSTNKRQKWYNTFRYLNDILALNNVEFQWYTKEICPAELTLIKAYTNSKHFTF